VRKVLPPHFAFIFVGAVASCCAQGSVRKVLPPYFSSAQVVLGCCVLILSRSDFRVFLTSFFCSWNPRGQSASLGPLLANFCCECKSESVFVPCIDSAVCTRLPTSDPCCCFSFPVQIQLFLDAAFAAGDFGLRAWSRVRCWSGERTRHALSTQLTFFFVLIFILSVGKPPWS
jgi:hypothetical protein